MEVPVCVCGEEMLPVWENEYETTNSGIKTGRVRRICSYFSCPRCLRTQPVDDSFDGPWRLFNSRGRF